MNNKDCQLYVADVTLGRASGGGREWMPPLFPSLPTKVFFVILKDIFSMALKLSIAVHSSFAGKF